MEIVTARLTLRDIAPADAPAFLAYQADPRYAALHGPDEANPAHASDLLATFARWAAEAPRRHYQLGVFDRDRALVGCAGLRDVDAVSGTAELGVELAPDHWGRHGLAVEIVRALLAFGFDRLGLREVRGWTASGNARVARLARWFGAEPTATRDGPSWMRDRGWREVGWRIGREAWARAPRPGRPAAVDPARCICYPSAPATAPNGASPARPNRPDHASIPGPALDLFLHNTLSRTKERFEPIDPARVRVYVCGPTVYQRIHVGNARSFVVFDVLHRLLRHLYGAEHVAYVRNITDIDDRILAQARVGGEVIGEITERTTAGFREDMAALRCLPPTEEPRATEHVPGMVALTLALIERGHAYAAEGHVLFHVPSMPAYGRLSGRDRDEQVAGARVEVAPYKRDPADFVLWKPSADDQPGWDSPWGRGRPGWHVECSAMAEVFLGPLPFDIHAGGLDLIFPHHENEIAQSCCARGVESMARYWLHNGFLDMRGEKMSKSLGNVIRVPEALAMAPGEAVRLHLLGTHYRQPSEFSEEGLKQARGSLRRFYRVLASAGVRAGDRSEPDRAVADALADDLGTPSAIAVLHATATRANGAETPEERRALALTLKGQGSLLGLLQDEPDAWLKTAGHGELPDAEVEARLEERRAARRSRDFARADAIRAELEAAGIVLKDRPDGATAWERR
jgi:cysteinyl-tRNA synthetase